MSILRKFITSFFLRRLMEDYVQPYATILYPSVMGKEQQRQQLDDHHGFVVEYEPGKDINLGFHVDDSQVDDMLMHASCSAHHYQPLLLQVTLNVCLGREFTGGQLYFRGVRSPDIM